METRFGETSFRPLDGESISKLYWFAYNIDIDIYDSCRPLDGESISKLSSFNLGWNDSRHGFRPLDGESISKLWLEL